MLVLVGLGAPVTDVVLEVSLSDEFFNLFFECDAFFYGMANVSVILTVLVLVLFRAVPPHRVWSLVDALVLRGQEYILT